VGTPPQDLLLVMDTGSVVIWAPCTTDYVCKNCRVFRPRKSSSVVQVKCADPKCKDLCGTGNERGRCYGSIHNCSRVCPAYQLTMAREPLPGYLLSTERRRNARNKELRSRMFGAFDTLQNFKELLGDWPVR
jgi:hypothetical protein